MSQLFKGSVEEEADDDKELSLDKEILPFADNTLSLSLFEEILQLLIELCGFDNTDDEDVVVVNDMLLLSSETQSLDISSTDTSCLDKIDY